MVQDERILNAMREMCNSKLPHTDEQRIWHIANIPALLREARYDELDARFNRALTDSFTSREAEKRYFLARPKCATVFMIWMLSSMQVRKD